MVICFVCFPAHSHCLCSLKPRLSHFLLLTHTHAQWYQCMDHVGCKFMVKVVSPGALLYGNKGRSRSKCKGRAGGRKGKRARPSGDDEEEREEATGSMDEDARQPPAPILIFTAGEHSFPTINVVQTSAMSVHPFIYDDVMQMCLSSVKHMPAAILATLEAKYKKERAQARTEQARTRATEKLAMLKMVTGNKIRHVSWVHIWNE